MDICTLDTPLVKRVPNSLRSAFATVWGRLLNQAVTNKQVHSWAEFFMFPKCILWTPTRGGRRLAKKTSMVDLVRARISKWTTDRASLWKDVVERSQKTVLTQSKPKTANKA